MSHLVRVLALSGIALSACTPTKLPKETDTVAPSVQVLEPSQGARVETPVPTIQIKYADQGTGIAVVSFRAIVNDREISADFDHHSQGATGKVSPVRPLPLGDNELVVEVADRAGNVGRDRVNFVNTAGGWLEVSARSDAKMVRNVELVLDASGSMRDPIGLDTRMDVAKAAIESLVTKLPANTRLGLRAFSGCGRITELVSIGRIDTPSFLAKVNSIEPAGGTPLVASLLASFQALDAHQEGERIAVLVTDGGESCGGSIAKAINRAKDASTRIVVIGFEIGDQGLTKELRKLAEDTGGAYFDAREPEQLKLALERSVLRLTFRVFSADGKEVAKGDVDGDPAEVSTGTYQLRLDTAPPFIINDIKIGSLTRTRVSLGRASSGLTAKVDYLPPKN